MAFSIQCTNKGCREYQNPKLDINKDSDTYNEVICSNCGKTIENVSQFHKTAMKSIGQVKRDDNNKQAFAVSCPKCSKADRPILGQNNELLCKHCGAEQSQLSRPFAQALLSVLKSGI